MNMIQDINTAITEERHLLLSHPLYARIRTLDDLRTFTEFHVYAVWDFMSLLKALQRSLTCTQVPWFATPDPDTRYLINEIVLAEESDEYIDGRRLSHFEMYLDAMDYMQADGSGINKLVAALQSGETVEDAIGQLAVDDRVKAFLSYTFHIISEGKPHKIAAAFTFGREDLIPDMFGVLLQEIQVAFPDADLSRLVYYFQRHIELDGDEHGPLAMKMIQALAGDDPVKWEEIAATAKEALQKRYGLWDAILDHIEQ